MARRIFPNVDAMADGGGGNQYLTPHPNRDDYDEPGTTGSKTEEFERFMATSINAFDQMMDAVKGDKGDSIAYSSRPGSRAGSRPNSRPGSRPASPGRSSAAHLPLNFGDLAGTDSVALVGNEYMVSEVRAALGHSSSRRLAKPTPDFTSAPTVSF